MKFTTPRGWTGLACFSPALINWLAIYAGPRIQFALDGNPHGEGAMWAWAAWGIYSLMLGIVICLGLGGWIARNSASRWGIALGTVVYGIALMLVNSAIAFGGCALAMRT